ncbi:MAG: Nitrate transporter [Planctomycetes bacterium]|nr:Nitrate transporter [Planctomycetota bacterium]HRJ77614.1 MFS transporter [Planctomycetota bacterium]
MDLAVARDKGFWKAGHWPTLFTSLIYFDFCFAVWVLNGAMAPFISKEFGLDAAEKGFMISVPVIVGALMRFPLGLLAQYIGRKNAAQVEMGMIVVGLGLGWLFVESMAGVLAMGCVLGVAGASFGVALSLGSGWYPPKYKGLAMGIAGAGNSGAVLAVLLAPPLASVYGWKAVYGLAIIPIVLAMALLAMFAKEPPDREHKSLRDHLKILFDRDAWIFNLMYALTFGGYIGLTSFLPTLFHDQYGVAKENVGQYAAGIIVMASILRLVGGGLADRIGGLRMIKWLAVISVIGTAMAAYLVYAKDGPLSSPWVMVAVMVVLFSALGAGNGAVFQLLPLRFKGNTAVAGSLVGEIGGLAGGFLPNAMGVGSKYSGMGFTPGFLAGTALSICILVALAMVMKKWTTTWVGEGGRALPDATPLAEPAAPAQSRMQMVGSGT